MKLTGSEKLKIRIMAEGAKLTPAAWGRLTRNETPHTIGPGTSNGVELLLDNKIYVNCPVFFDGDLNLSKNIYNQFLLGSLRENLTQKWLKNTKLILDFRDGLFKIYNGTSFKTVKILNKPEYVKKMLPSGKMVSKVVFTQTDRAGLSPVGEGCFFQLVKKGCKFCGEKGSYYLMPFEDTLKATKLALNDKKLPARHIQVSGGTPSDKHLPHYIQTIERLCKNFPETEVDVMMSPQQIDVLEHLKKQGVNGVAINIEVYNEKIAAQIIPSKYKIGRKKYFETLTEAVKIFGIGKVRSLLIVGLEPMKDTLRGVSALARIGVIPILSPFRPISGTALENQPPPTYKFLLDCYLKSNLLVKNSCVSLGPKCFACQNNSLVFPRDIKNN